MSISLVPHLTWGAPPPSTVCCYVCFNCINSTKFLRILRFIPEPPHQGKVYCSTAVLARWWLAHAISLYKKTYPAWKCVYFSGPVCMAVQCAPM